jgi:AraC family transcriptional regulator, regulatory protein of adaptative response / methylated-DNA-[protein]-cysteine methyltransferase
MGPARTESEADQRWQAVLTRSPLAEGRFVYAVRSTGVFCRPTCPSRRPLRANVEFFATPANAVRAGYRPCLRCRPERGAEDSSAATLSAACQKLSAENGVRAADVARELGLSAAYFNRFFKRHLGVTPQQYRRRVLAARGRKALDNADSVTASIYQAGYSSSSRFYEQVATELGMKPSSALRGAPGEHIEYTTSECSLGCVCIAWTAKGVCDVSLGADSDALVKQLRARFSGATLEPRARGTWADAIVRGVDRAVSVTVPLDIRGTAFQERVWRALRSIPFGATKTYAQIAREVGAPNAARAVAAACAGNSLAVVVPCHRVVRSDGALSGYRWGVERKQKLLSAEKSARPKVGARIRTS